jgi:hypothetical protein
MEHPVKLTHIIISMRAQVCCQSEGTEAVVGKVGRRLVEQEDVIQLVGLESLRKATRVGQDNEVGHLITQQGTQWFQISSKNATSMGR